MGWFRRLFCPRSVYERRHQISQFWMNEFEGRVGYGPFKGLYLGQTQGWSSGDLAPKLFGLYEQELIKELVRVSNRRNVLIDVGAADGYYAIGALVGSLFDECIAFESSHLSRQVLQDLASLNSVDQKIRINGEANRDSLNTIEESVLNRSVMIVDIEGAEFDILDRESISKLSQTIILIEVHDWMVPEGEIKRAGLIETSS